MKISVAITVFNEEDNISKLLDALLAQKLKADEIIIVDGGSTDKTIEIIRHYEKKNRTLTLFVEKCSRSKGRNIGIEMARNNIIAVTDAGCLPDKNWLKEITEPFKNKGVDMVAGFYKMTQDTDFRKALSVFLGVRPENFDVNFLPSTRSVAFRRELYIRVGGFPERLDDTAEDTVFNYKVIKDGAKIARVKTARVEWAIPDNLTDAFNKLFSYAKGDAASKIFIHPLKGLMSHNIKTLFVFLRYLTGFFLFVKGISYTPLLFVLGILIILYIFWAFRKVYIATGSVNAGLWGIVLQFTADVAVMGGFLKGISEQSKT